MTDQPLPRQPWDQMPGEPDLWYGRFQLYLSGGPARTLQDTARRAGELARNQPYQWNIRWSEENRRWRWRERAHAWDVYQRNLLALSERNVRIGLRDRRLNVMEETLETIREALDTADISSADQSLARQWLPQLRIFLRDLLVAERQEFERTGYAKNDEDGVALITADDLAAAQRVLDATPHTILAPDPTVPIRRVVKARLVVVCRADEEGFDLPALRAIRTATGLTYQRLLDPTRFKFTRSIARMRDFGHPIEFMHIALDASAAGVELLDGPVDNAWLRERLAGIRVLLLARCAARAIGDWRGLVPYVISLRDDIPGEDAAALAAHFWRNIGLGQDPAAALDAALAHVPPATAAAVTRHW